VRFVALAIAATVAVSGCTAASTVAEPVRRVLSSAIVDPARRYADERLAGMTIEQKVASLLMVHIPGLDPAATESFAAQTGIGGVILMGDNIPDPPSAMSGMTAAMSPEAALPLLIATDQEGGEVSRIPTDTADGALQLRDEAPDAARAAFASRGALLHELGISINFGVIADVAGDPASFIYDRSLGATPGDAAARVAAAVTGERGTVLTTLKHFPGHGVSPEDSHTHIPQTSISLDDWRAGHEAPFAAGIAAGAELIMFGHLQFDAIDPQPATLSPMWHQLVRQELGFHGLIVTDDMDMLEYSGRADLADQNQNAIRAVAAGNDLLLYVGDVNVPGVVAAVSSAVRAGDIPLDVLDSAAERVLIQRRMLSSQHGDFVYCDHDCQAVVR
jgi:beta-N-acetylhexosaminidase